MERRTIVVDGPLAFRMRRVVAARRSESGAQILTLPLLAARLAGGFLRPATSEEVYAAIRKGLDQGEFGELESIRRLPGMTRAVASTLAKVWLADLSLEALSALGLRLTDMAALERRVRSHLPIGALTPRDLRDAAQARVTHAGAVLGSIELEGVAHVPPVWRPLLVSLATTVEVSWRSRQGADTSWFADKVIVDVGQEVASVEIVSCANPRAEVVEALRWARELLATQRVQPQNIAICAAATEEWDEHFLVLSSDAGLPVHFSHGVPTLASQNGQACAALADVLLNGITQNRVRRLFSHALGRSRALRELPATWRAGLRAQAALFELDQWRRALDDAWARRGDGVDPRPFLLPALELLSQGPLVAASAGEEFLGAGAQAIWSEALRRAPATALEFSLQELRAPDGRDPSASVVWCPASHLAGAPRPWVWLCGMTSRSWPRRAAENPLIPDHILRRQVLDPNPVNEQDRRAYAIISACATSACVLSQSRRSAQGSLLCGSQLTPQGIRPRAHKRARIPPHAFSETDRLLARPDEAAASDLVAPARACWRDWHREILTEHDGVTRAEHPAIVRAVEQVQSATSLRLMLRDPLAFVWRYALGWRAPADDENPLTLEPSAFGELAHELLKRGVDELELANGFARASENEIAVALDASAAVIRARWPLERAVPPELLWQHTVTTATKLAMKALTLDEQISATTRSWTEVQFGRAAAAAVETGDLPWPQDAQVTIPSTDMRVQGAIDRLDVRSDGIARVTDYKTSAEPFRASRIVLGGGAELQRVIYALASRQLLAQTPRIVARLIFLAGDSPQQHKLRDVDQAIEDLAAHVALASTLLRQGKALPGPDASLEWNEFRLALPATISIYFQIKQRPINNALGSFTRVWGCQ
jgi:hypothetical protein